MAERIKRKIQNVFSVFSRRAQKDRVHSISTDQDDLLEEGASFERREGTRNLEKEANNIESRFANLIENKRRKEEQDPNNPPEPERKAPPGVELAGADWEPIQEPVAILLPVRRELTEPLAENRAGSEAQEPCKRRLPLTTYQNDSFRVEDSIFYEKQPWLSDHQFTKYPKSNDQFKYLASTSDGRFSDDIQRLFYQMFSTAEGALFGINYIESQIPDLTHAAIMKAYQAWTIDGKPDYSFSVDEDKVLVTSLAFVDMSSSGKDDLKDNIRKCLEDLQKSRFTGEFKAHLEQHGSSSKRHLEALFYRMRSLSINFEILRKVYGTVEISEEQNELPKLQRVPASVSGQLTPSQLNRIVEFNIYHGDELSDFMELVNQLLNDDAKAKFVFDNLEGFRKMKPARYTVMEYRLLINTQNSHPGNWDLTQYNFPHRALEGLKRRYKEAYRAFDLMNYLDKAYEIGFIEIKKE